MSEQLTKKNYNDIYHNYLKQYHPHCSEFHQAVDEILEDVREFYFTHEKYAKANILERIIEPDRIIKFRVCWEDDKGIIQVNRAWRVQFNNALGAYKGGLRFHPSVNESIFKFLGFEQCFKNALTGMPMGGGKGGSDFDPKGKSESEIRRFCESFMQELHRHIGANVDVPAGDIGVGAREIGYMFGHYLKITNAWEGVITGKAPNFGGSCGRTEATGYGVVYFLEEMLNHHKSKIAGKKTLISGAGNVAIHAAEKIIQEDAKVLTFSDSGGTIYFENGITPEELRDIRILKEEQRGRLKDFKSGKFIEGKSPWQIGVDAELALPCATQNEVNGDDVKKLIKHGVLAIAEGANMPLDSEAQKVVIENNVLYGPGKAANAGGVAVSGLERTQNATLRSWSLEKVDKELRKIVSEIHNRCTQNIEKQQGVYNYRKGANIYGFKKLADTMIAFGVK